LNDDERCVVSVNIEMVEIDLEALVPDLSRDGAFVRVDLAYRIDPLMGTSTRIISGSKLNPTERTDLTTLTNGGGFCPFCLENVDNVTAPFPSEIVPEGRVRVGSAVVVPNVMAYSTSSAVGIYDTRRHFIALNEFDVTTFRDAFEGMLQHARAVRRYDKRLIFSSINANYLPSSGSSLIHPHLQSSHDFVPLTSQRQRREASRRFLQETGLPYLSTLIEQERDGDRFVGETGSVTWLTPFAPTGFHEVWGVIPSLGDLVDLDRSVVEDLATGLTCVLRAYDDANLNAFNFTLQGGGVDAADYGFELCFKIVSRAPVEPYYRSDVTYFEKLASETMIDTSPESWAISLRRSFGPLGQSL
jgi:galactose-1-phosphate uridylyltransferase